jgi:hypothetical protein
MGSPDSEQAAGMMNTRLTVAVSDFYRVSMKSHRRNNRRLWEAIPAHSPANLPVEYHLFDAIDYCNAAAKRMVLAGLYY